MDIHSPQGRQSLHLALATEDPEEELPALLFADIDQASADVCRRRLTTVACTFFVVAAFVASTQHCLPGWRGVAWKVNNRGDHGALDKLEAKDMLAPVEQTLSRFWPRRATAECRERLERLDRLHAAQPQLQPAIAYDKDFPPSSASIGAVSVCTSLTGLMSDHRTDACGDLKAWESMEQVAQRSSYAFSVFKPGGVQYADIDQGRLGSCYLLAGLASIAYAHPHVIEDMFVRRELWKDNVFTTRWLIGGKEMLIEVDNMIPVTSVGGAAWFAQPSSTGEFWPVILEKAWAKIHTSYSAIEGGWWPDPVSAITRARVHSIYHSNWVPDLAGYHIDTQEELWDELLWATRQNFPMGVSTSSPLDDNRRYSVNGYHAYAVFRAYETPSYGKVVEVYNPWNHDLYKGRIPNPSQEDGVFIMGFDEYFDAFDTTFFAELVPNYVVTTQRIQHGQESRWSHLNFKVSSAGVFYVSVSWPSHRLVKPCSMLIPDITLQVVKGDARGNAVSTIFHGERDGKTISSLTATITAGPGSYHIMTTAAFDRSTFINDLFLSIYAPEHVDITEVTGITEGDRFYFAPWGAFCVAHWIDGELWMRGESAQSTNGSKIWKTTGGGGRALISGKRVQVLWDNSRHVDVQVMGEDRIRAWPGGVATDFERSSPMPIPGSSDWWTCQHSHIFTCGSSCCCDRGSRYSSTRKECRPI